VSKVKEDKTRVKEMVAQDLPGKPRYPLFSAAVGLCCAMDAADEAVEEPVEVRGKSGSDVKAAAVPTNHAYAGQGAFVDSPGHFVDLESNMPDRHIIGSDKIGSGSKITGDVTGNDEAEFPIEALRVALTSVAVVNTDTNERTEAPVKNTLQVEKEMCEVSDISDESADESESSSQQSEDIEVAAEVAAEEEVEVENHAFSVSARGSENSYVTGDSEEYESSDDGDVVYTISSEGDAESNGNVM